VKSRGELVVLTRVGPATYYDSPEGPAGFEYDLVSAFAEQLGVRLRVVTAERFADILPRLARGEADLAAAGITITAARTEVVRFTPPYQEIRQQVVHRRDLERPPGCAGALLGRQIEVIAGSSYVERLNELKHDYPELTWVEVADRPTEEVLRDVWEGLTELTVADSNIFAVNRQHFPELQVAFDLKTGDQLGWAFPLSDDDSLYQAAVKFLESMRGSGELARLIDRYYGPASRSNYVNLTIYHLRIQTRLPQYQALFERAGHQYNLDWRLLAALGYQESYWDPRAVSFTGVRGMMMLTEETATQMGVQNRLDTEQSIDGGARYLAQMIDRMPDTITGPDRAWMALAAYNLGINHVEDARILTEQQRGDPNKWNDVKDRLPLLAQARWAARTRYGFARGMEGVIFVNRVRTYFDVLTKFDQEEKAAKRSEALKLTAPAI
jgi:membrane-bound lytic murein transglycosylase F